MIKQINDIREFQTRLAEVEEGSLVNLRGEDYLSRALLRKSLIEEETKELHDAILAKDAVEVLDAGVDTLYILLGTMHEYGVLDKFIDAWNLVHDNNMTKLDENGQVQKSSAGKVIKPSNYKPVNLTVLFNEESL